ncbi:hypothetical protein [Nonomuraea sp. NPDC049695]|uniref:hypothetical protein n=1 Tax=Nonomuraea sp. NPDC049695 TaxID=3154734 RepID=UPI00342D60CA
MPAVLGRPARGHPAIGLQRLYRNREIVGEALQGFQDAEQRLAPVRVRAAVRLHRLDFQRQVAELELGTGLESMGIKDTF